MESINSIIEKEVTNMFEGILDFVHVAIPIDRWPQMRSKILKKGNDCIRNLQRQLGEEE